MHAPSDQLPTCLHSYPRLLWHAGATQTEGVCWFVGAHEVVWPRRSGSVKDGEDFLPQMVTAHGFSHTRNTVEHMSLEGVEIGRIWLF